MFDLNLLLYILIKFVHALIPLINMDILSACFPHFITIIR